MASWNLSWARSYFPLLKCLTPSLRLFLARSLFTRPQPVRLAPRTTIPRTASPVIATVLWFLVKMTSLRRLLLADSHAMGATLQPQNFQSSLQVIDLKPNLGSTRALYYVYDGDYIAVWFGLWPLDEHSLVRPLIQEVLESRP